MGNSQQPKPEGPPNPFIAPPAVPGGTQWFNKGPNRRTPKEKPASTDKADTKRV